jgi:hypothetical protein
MSDVYFRNLLRIASKLSKTDPILAYELERRTLALVHPGVQKFEEHVKDVVEILKGLKDELVQADRELDVDKDFEEFAKFFDDEAEAQKEELSNKLKIVSASMRVAEETANISDIVKNIFKKKPKKTEDESIDTDYRMDDSTMDEFVEGKRGWEDPSVYAEKETKENKEFFEDSKSIVNLLDKVRDEPSRKMVKFIIDHLNDLIDKGTRLMHGVYEKTKPVEIEDDEKKKPEEKKPGVKKTFNLDNTIEHYMDMLKESSGDEQKVVKYLKEFFNAVKPALEEDRAALASNRAKILPILVAAAKASPRTKSILASIVRRWDSVTNLCR